MMDRMFSPQDEDDDVVSWGWFCQLCEYAEHWTTKRSRDQASLWHVYVTHPQRWEAIYPREEPGPLPETLGRKE